MRCSQTKTNVLGILFVLGFVLMTAAPAGANTSANLRISCAGCDPGATTLVTSSTSGTFSITNTGQAFSGTVFVVALTPDAGSGGGLSIVGGQSVPFQLAGFNSGFLESFITTPSVNLNGLNFGSLASASSQGLGGVQPTSFFVKEWQATTGYTGSNFGNCCTYSNFVTGTVVVAFAVGANGNVINTPLSGSLTVNTPEPASLLFLGSGLAGIGFWQWKRRKELTA